MKNYDALPPQLIIDDGSGFYRFRNAVWGNAEAWVQHLALPTTIEALRRRLARTKGSFMWARSQRGRLMKFYREDAVRDASTSSTRSIRNVKS